MAVLDTIAKNRLVTGFIIGALVLSAILLGGPFLLTLILAFIIIATKEYADILRNKNLSVSEESRIPSEKTKIEGEAVDM